MALLTGCTTQKESMIRNNIEGWWSYGEQDHVCEKILMKYSLSGDGQTLLVYAPDGLSFGSDTMSTNLKYIILDEIDYVLRMKGVGEVRRTDSGKLVKWDLKMKDKDTFCWHRTDWSSSQCTKDFVRCPNISTNQ